MPVASEYFTGTRWIHSVQLSSLLAANPSNTKGIITALWKIVEPQPKNKVTSILSSKYEFLERKRILFPEAIICLF